MKFIDMNDGREYTLTELKKEWDQLRKEEPENHADNFKTELFVILMDTINGRNDCDIIGPTPREISNIIINLRAKV